MSGALVKSGQYSFTNMSGDVLLALPHDASFRLNAKVSEKRDIVSDFPLKYLSDIGPPATPAVRVVPPSPKPPVVKDPELPPTKDKEAVKDKTKPPSKPGPMAQPKPAPTPAPDMTDRPVIVVPYVLRRIEAICGTGDALISISSFGGTVRLKKL
ncbi:MAG TPA: hypothetical protein VGW58_16525, partial [Pyrinomonadaceae bacterium]|nr:hypothetical protein [Pyrinomonadaceae bacterium]